MKRAYVTCVVLLLAAQCSFSQIAFENFPLLKPLKRGKLYYVRWNGATGSDTLTFELTKNGSKVWELTMNDTGSNTLQLPVNIKPGKSYVLNVYREHQLVNKLEALSIKRRIPTLVKFSPVVIAAVILLIPRETEDGFPSFPLPP